MSLPLKLRANADSVSKVLAKTHNNGLEATSLRVGQVSGSAASGAWNVTDWFPIIVKSSLALGTMPNLDEVSTTRRMV